MIARIYKKDGTFLEYIECDSVIAPDMLSKAKVTEVRRDGKTVAIVPAKCIVIIREK